MAKASWTGRRVLVTGAASGIGRATAGRLAERGAALVLTDINQGGLERAVSELRAGGATVVHSAALDLADPGQVDAFAAEVHATGPLDAVMNIAGISTWGAVERLEHHHWRRTIEVDLMGPIHVIEAFVPEMIRARRGGHLVNVSSAAGLIGLPWHAPYSAAKFGLRGVSEVLRFDLRRHRIGVTLVCPGAVRTPLVGTVDIVGIDRTNPRMQRFMRGFERRASSPEAVAARILDGVERRRYLVHTSREIQLAFWLQRWCEPVYALIMQLINHGFQHQLRRLLD